LAIKPQKWSVAIDISTSKLNTLPGIEVSYLESETTALASATTTNLSQLIQLLVLLSGLIAAVLLASHLASKPLRLMLEQVGMIGKTGDLTARVTQQGPTEFQELGQGFNEMLGKLQQTTVSQEKYRESEERFSFAVQGTNDGLWNWDLTTDAVWYSPRYKEMLGYQDHEFPNVLDSFKTNLHPEDAADTWNAVQQHFNESRGYDVEHRMRIKSGEYLWVRARGAAICDQNGTAIRMSGTIQDISDIKRYQQVLERSNYDLQQFAFIASHDLQEPLRKVASFCCLLRQDYWEQLDDDGRKYIDFAVDGAARMQTLIRDLLLFSKIGAEEECDTPIDTHAAFRSAISNLESSIEDSQAVITHDTLPPLLANEREIAQLFKT
jgi:PAS domain S-box-containing protein